MLELVKDYYGRQHSGTADLKTTACCDISASRLAQAAACTSRKGT